MASINSSTMLSIPKKKTPAVAPKSSTTTLKKKTTTNGSSVGAPARRGASAPPLKPKSLATATAIAALQADDGALQQQRVTDFYRTAVGAAPLLVDLAAPHTASTTRDRQQGAADLAVAAKHLSMPFVLKTCGILNELQRNLFPEGIETLLTRGGDNISLVDNTDVKSNDGDENEEKAIGLKPSASAVSLTSLLDDMTIGDTTTVVNSVNSDSKRGKTSPPAAREGCLLILRALTEIVGGPQAEPYVCGAFLAAALDETASTNSAVREAAEDCVKALVGIANPWSYSTVVAPIVLQSLQCTDWRVKTAALECLVQLSAQAPKQVHLHIPTLIPACTNQVWDTKPQVSKGAKAALLAICETNVNSDIRSAIPAVVNAICKPAETNKAVSELMGTTFVVPVDASTLAILCPVLARALKEKLAIHKRAACLVISNMSKLVESPASVAPFGSLLVPELQKVAANVQFEEIRDESLKALQNLTKALGDLYSAATDPAAGVESEETKNDADATSSAAALAELKAEQARVEEEQRRIQEERDRIAAEDEAHRLREIEERRKFKEAMDAQRELDRIAAEEAAASAAAEQQRKEMMKLSTKGEGGKCQGCGLKKCPKSCSFYTGK
jgi:hypothetical protein